MKKVSLFILVVALLFSFSSNLSFAISVNPYIGSSQNSFCFNLQNNLKVGSRDSSTGGDVTKLQTFLNQKGFLSSNSTGYFGIFTKNAVINYQKSIGLTAQGFVGSATRGIINNICSNSSNTDSNNPVRTILPIVTPIATGTVPVDTVANNPTVTYIQTNAGDLNTLYVADGSNSVKVNVYGTNLSKVSYVYISDPSQPLNQYGLYSGGMYNPFTSISDTQGYFTSPGFVSSGSYTVSSNFANGGMFPLQLIDAFGKYYGTAQSSSLSIKIVPIISSSSSGDTTPRIAYWSGKVNQHVDSNGNWTTDPDGTSGASIDQLTYCQKWYPNTTSVSAYKSEAINTWKRASGYEQSNYSNTVQSYQCVQGSNITNSTYTVTFDVNGNGNDITVPSPISVNINSNQTSPISITLPQPSANPGDSVFSNNTFYWNTKSDGTGTSYLSGSYFYVSSNVTLYAVLKANTQIQVSSDTTPRIAYWSGKVNQHVDSNGNWTTDPDGTSGASIDQLTYCQKWYPNTTSVSAYKSEAINTWKRASGYEQSNYSNTVQSYQCVQGSIPTQSSQNQLYIQHYILGSTVNGPIIPRIRITEIQVTNKTNQNLYLSQIPFNLNTNGVNVSNFTLKNTSNYISIGNVSNGVTSITGSGTTIINIPQGILISGGASVTLDLQADLDSSNLYSTGPSTYLITTGLGDPTKFVWTDLNGNKYDATSLSLSPTYYDTGVSTVNITNPPTITNPPVNSQAQQTQTCSAGSVIPATQTCPTPTPVINSSPSNLQATNVTANSLALTWTNPVSYPTCFVYYGTDYNTVNNFTGTGNAGGCSNINISNLTPNTTYYFKVDGWYNNSYSGWSNILTVTTNSNTSVSAKVLPVTNTLTPMVYGAGSYQFARSLTVGMRGDDVKMLQKFLNTQGYKVELSGYYGQDTKNALINFQNAHKTEILDKAGIDQGTGDFFFSTLSFVNNLLLNSTTINLNN